MAASVEIANLFSTLGLKIDKAAWGEADTMLERTRGSLAGVAKLAVGAMAAFVSGSAVKEGLAFNSTLEDTRNQIAGMLALAKHTDLADNLEDADGLMGSLQERAKKLPGSLTDYTKVLGMIAQPITDAGIGLKDLEDITVGTAVAAKAMSIDLEAGARDVNQAIMGQFHSTDQLTGRILGSLGYIGEAGRARFNALSKEQRAAVLKDALTQKQLAELADAQSKTASGRWDTFKATIQETLGRVAAPLFAKLSMLLAAANDWLDKNADAVERVAAAIGNVLGGALDLITDTIAFLTNGSDEAIAALIGIGVAIATVVVPALAAMAAGWIAAAAPILAVVAAVGLITFGIIKLIRHWDHVREIGGRAWQWIKDKAIGFVDYIRSIPGRIVDAFWRMVESIKTFFSDLFEWIKDEVKKLPSKIPVLGTLGTKLGNAAGAVTNFFTGDTHLDAIDTINEPAEAAAPVFVPPAAAGGKNVTVGPTTINIDATNMTPEQLRPAVEDAVDSRLGDHLRAED